MATVFHPLKHGVLIIDLEDWLKWKHIKWTSKWSACTKSYYVVTYTKKHNLRDKYLHRLIMGDPEGLVVDHIFHNTLDCRKKNLRVVTPSQNVMNTRPIKTHTSKYKCVYWDSQRSKWMVRVTKEGRKYFAGRFSNEDEAGVVANRKMLEIHGEYACLNKLSNMEVTE